MKKLVLIMLIFSFFASFSQDELIINDAAKAYGWAILSVL